MTFEGLKPNEFYEIQDSTLNYEKKLEENKKKLEKLASEIELVKALQRKSEILLMGLKEKEAIDDEDYKKIHESYEKIVEESMSRKRRKNY